MSWYFLRGQRGCLLDANHVVFQAEVGINVLFILKMTRDDPRPVGKRQNPAKRGKFMVQPPEQPAAQILEMFQVRLADLAQQQTFQTRHALAIIRAHLREQPMRFAAAASAAVANRHRPVRCIAQPRRRRRGQLPRLQNHVGAGEAVHLRFRATSAATGQKISFPGRHAVFSGSAGTASTSTISPGSGSP